MLLAVFDDLIEEIQAHFFFDAAVDAPGNEFTGDTFTARLHDKIVDSLAMRPYACRPDWGSVEKADCPDRRNRYPGMGVCRVCRAPSNRGS